MFKWFFVCFAAKQHHEDNRLHIRHQWCQFWWCNILQGRDTCFCMHCPSFRIFLVETNRFILPGIRNALPCLKLKTAQLECSTRKRKKYFAVSGCQKLVPGMINGILFIDANVKLSLCGIDKLFLWALKHLYAITAVTIRDLDVELLWLYHILLCPSKF